MRSPLQNLLIRGCLEVSSVTPPSAAVVARSWLSELSAGWSGSSELFAARSLWCSHCFRTRPAAARRRRRTRALSVVSPRMSSLSPSLRRSPGVGAECPRTLVQRRINSAPPVRCALVTGLVEPQRGCRDQRQTNRGVPARCHRILVASHPNVYPAQPLLPGLVRARRRTCGTPWALGR